MQNYKCDEQGMWVYVNSAWLWEGMGARHPSRLNSTPFFLISCFPSSLFLFFYIHLVQVVLPAVKCCALPQGASSQLRFRAPFRAF